MSEIRIASVQNSPVYLDVSATVKKVCSLIRKASADGARLVLFPEAFLSGYPDWVWLLPASKKQEINDCFRMLYESSVTIPDKSINEICSVAKETETTVVIGVNEKNSESSNASLYNTMVYIDSTGTILGKHRKLIPTGGERLMWGQGDGSTMVSFDTMFGKIGGLICWENFMPLARYAMYTQGVQIYLAPTWDSSEAWQISMRHIAREGGMYVMSCAPAMTKDDIPDNLSFKELYPEDRHWINKGNSVIIDPSGKVIAGPLTEKQDILYADIDLDLIQNQKWLFDVAGHYDRPDVFDFSIKE